MTFRAALAVLVLLPAPALAQEDLRALIIDFAHAGGCEAGLDMLAMMAVDGMGRPRAELEAAIDAMVAAGEAERAADGSSVAVRPPLCEAVAGTSLAMAAGWIEGVLTGAEGCRMPTAALRDEVLGQGLPAEAFGPALSRLEAEGTVAPDGDDVVHTGC